ncbi:MAG TPA: hypothetical protein PLC42_00160 [Parachlamydiaceae bacterium]|nr:hypothetical protein [Parachlamydiaceae bacterium]
MRIINTPLNPSAPNQAAPNQGKLNKTDPSPLTSIFQKGHTEPKTIQDIHGKTWKVKFMNNPQAIKESGATEQRKVMLTNNESRVTKQARIKQIDTLNEALTYHMIQQNTSNPLSGFMAQFITTLDKNGSPINLQEELEKCNGSIEQLCKKKEFQPAYIVIRDLVNEIEENKDKTVTTNKIKDFKMVKPSLQGTNMENKLHGYASEGFIYRTVRKIFFTLSGCSFAFQKATKSKWYTVIINNIKRMMTLGKTKQAINKEFEKLSLDQLKAMKTHLASLREAMKNSGYVFSDASLLFLPSVQKEENDKATNKLDIRLIDMSHALAKSEILDKIWEERNSLFALEKSKQMNTKPYKQHERNLSKLEGNLKEYEVMERDMDNSLIEMESMLDDIIRDKELPNQSTLINPRYQ